MHAEKWRLGVLIGCYGLFLVFGAVRRQLDTALGEEAAFYRIMTLYAMALAVLGLAYADTARRARRGQLLPAWRLWAGGVVDVGVPMGSVLILHLFSPRGELAALSAPVLLIVPIVLLLSALRLRPGYCLALGLVAAILHALLTLYTLSSGAAPASEAPRLLTYAVLLAVCGCAAALVARFMRRVVQEAVSEALTAEKSASQLALVRRELDIASEIQRGLLPATPPAVEGFDIAGMARPAAEAGGDYFDWLPLGDGRVVVAIADVTGHGIGPAMVMAVCRAYSRATAPRVNGPEEFLSRLNTLVTQDLGGGRFITMAVAVVSPDGSVELLSAGHGPTFHYHASTGKVSDFGGNGLPLGIADDEQYNPAAHLTLERGDVLVMLTDGFMEHPSPSGAQFGQARLSEAIARGAALRKPAAELIRDIDHAVAGFAAGSVQTDDMTAVVIRRL